MNINEYLNYTADPEPSGAVLMPNKRMQLITREEAENLPAVLSKDGQGYEAEVVMKFFAPVGNWTWFVTEGQMHDRDGRFKEECEAEGVEFVPDNVLFFGLVIGFEQELGNFSLSELAGVSMSGMWKSLGIERDLHFTPKPLHKCDGVKEPMWSREKRAAC